jgi:polyphosphate kinase
MPRNLDYRVEALTPVEDAGIKRHLIDDVLTGYLHDNVQATVLGPDGIYRRPPRAPDEPRIDMQARLINVPDLAARRLAESDGITTSWHTVDRPRPLWIDE